MPPGPPTDLSTLSAVAVNGDVSSLYTSGNLLFAGTSDGELSVFDITDPLVPSLLGSVVTGTRILEITEREGYAFVAGSPSLSIVDVRAPDAPRFLCSGDTGELATSIDVSGDYAYLSLNGPLAVFDISVIRNL